MATPVQVTFDCDDPHRMAHFWAAALGYDKEDHTALVAELLRSGVLAADATDPVTRPLAGLSISDRVTARTRRRRGG